MPPKSIKENKPDFFSACNLGDTERIIEIFNQTSPNLYADGLRLFLDFLSKTPPEKSDFASTRSNQAVLKLFATRLDLYSWDFIATQIKILHGKYTPAAKTLFRSFLRQMLILYALLQTKKTACSRFPVSTVQELATKKTEDFVNDRHTFMIHYPILRLFYRSKKTGFVKHTADLGRQHIALKANLPNVAAGNAATAALTFMLKISRPGHVKKYIEVTLPIIIPTNASLDNRALHFDDLSSAARSYKPYEKLKILYDQGLRFFGVTEKKHGHHPEYENLDKPRAADSIKHSEQALALYLYEEPHVQALVNQLVLKLHELGDSIRAGDNIKVIAIALHFHSSKTPCAVCETVLTGLMDRENGAFLQRFKDVLSKTQDVFKFRIPKTGVRLHVLYSADDTDADHKENKHQYIANITQHAMRDKSGIVFCSLFQHGRTLNYASLSSTPDYTVLSSGGSSSEKTRGTNAKINAERKKGMDELLAKQREFRERIDKEAKAKKLAEQFAQYEQFCPWLFETLGVQVKPIVGDGNCQFTSVAEQLLQAYPAGLPVALQTKVGHFGTREELAHRLRLLTKIYMQQHRGEFVSLIGDEDFPVDWQWATDFDTYLNYIQCDKTWGGEHTLRALVNVLQLPIFVLHPDMMKGSTHIENRIYLPNGTALDDFDQQRLLVISYNGASHYETLNDRPSEQLIELINANRRQPAHALSF